MTGMSNVKDGKIKKKNFLQANPIVSNIKACNTSQGIKILFTQCSHKLLLSLLAVVSEQMEILY